MKEITGTAVGQAIMASLDKLKAEGRVEPDVHPTVIHIGESGHHFVVELSDDTFLELEVIGHIVPSEVH